MIIKSSKKKKLLFSFNKATIVCILIVYLNKHKFQ